MAATLIRASARAMALVVAIGAGTPWLAARQSAMQMPTVDAVQAVPAPLLKPFVDLPKARFATTEQVFFWIGVKTADGSPTFAASIRSGRVLITRPDGSTRADQVSMNDYSVPMAGWRGGHGLGNEAPQVGRYSVAFEVAGEQSPAASFTVERIAILDRVKAEFEFPSPIDPAASGTAVTFVVHNESDQTIQFPYRGQMMAEVSEALRRSDGGWTSSFFVPSHDLLAAAGLPVPRTHPDAGFTWKTVARILTVVVQPGGTYRLAFALPAPQGIPQGRPIPAGDYVLKLSTTIELLIGTEAGAYADLCPIRLAVS